jgi:hypothetical protein
MPDIAERSGSLSDDRLEKLVDRLEPRGYFCPAVAGGVRSITVRLIGTPPSDRAPNWLSAQAVPVSWAGSVFLRLQQLREYPKNWDSYGGRPLTTAAYLGAHDLLGRIMFQRFPKPSIVPTGRGGVQFEWHKKGSHLEVYVSSDGSAEV